MRARKGSIKNGEYASFRSSGKLSSLIDDIEALRQDNYIMVEDEENPYIVQTAEIMEWK